METKSEQKRDQIIDLNSSGGVMNLNVNVALFLLDVLTVCQKSVNAYYRNTDMQK